ncbi:MAG: hypothetical protein AAF519_12145 [Bacteroidota bacterium]
MKRLIPILLFALCITQGCNRNKYIIVKHVKPVSHKRPYNRKKDKRKKRTKYVKMKILKESKELKTVKVKKPKSKIAKDQIQTEDIKEVVNEADSTGIF